MDDGVCGGVHCLLVFSTKAMQRSVKRARAEVCQTRGLSVKRARSEGSVSTADHREPGAVMTVLWRGTFRKIWGCIISFLNKTKKTLSD
ncbi:hypothetical protein DPEC_G00135550, partial [Dallia pectoralis]